MAPHLQALLLLQLVLLSSLASAPHRADAWGKQGHIMVCKIAEKYLSEKAAAAVQDLLPESAGGELSTVCPWADTVKFHYRWSSPLHYANTPNVCNFKFSNSIWTVAYLMPLHLAAAAWIMAAATVLGGFYGFFVHDDK